MSIVSRVGRSLRSLRSVDTNTSINDKIKKLESEKIESDKLMKVYKNRITQLEGHRTSKHNKCEALATELYKFKTQDLENTEITLDLYKKIYKEWKDGYVGYMKPIMKVGDDFVWRDNVTYTLRNMLFDDHGIVFKF